MSIGALIDLGIGPGATIRFVLTGGLGGKSAAGALSPAVTGKKKKADPRQWFTLPNGMRILATPENYGRFAAKYPKLEETPAEPSVAAEVRSEPVSLLAGSIAETRLEPVAEEKYDGPLLGIAPKSEIKIPEAESDLRASLAAAEKLEAERLAREIEEEDDAIVLELIMKDTVH